MVCSYSASVAVRTRPRSFPSIGENFSITGPLPDQLPLKTPGFSAPIPSLFRTDCIRHRFALCAKELHRFVNDLARDIERRPEPNRVVARFQNKQPAIEEPLPKFVASFRIGKVERDEKTATAHGSDDRLLTLQLLERFQKVIANHSCVLDQVFLLDDPQKMRRTNHVRVIAAPGGIQSARQTKRVVRHFIE